jgi:sporulation protein YlmC with PRC-barrel domain
MALNTPGTTPSGHTRAILSSRVVGTEIRDPSGANIGSVEDIVLDKLSNNIMFAVVGFGGFLGIGEKYHPIPWSLLDYDPEQNCYTVNLTREQLEAAPSDSIEELTRNNGMNYRDRAYDYYKASRYW